MTKKQKINKAIFFIGTFLLFIILGQEDVSANYAATVTYVCSAGGVLSGTTCTRFDQCKGAYTGKSPSSCTTSPNSGCKPPTTAASFTFDSQCKAQVNAFGGPYSLSPGQCTPSGIYACNQSSAVTYVATLSYSCPSGGILSGTTCLTPVNGVCGSSNGQTFASAPAANFCNSGNYSGLSGSGPWSWSCIGSSGGATAACSAQKTSPPPIYNCSQCSPIYSYANESFTSNDVGCGTATNIGAKTYTNVCGCGVKLFNYSNFTSICTPPINGACGLSNGQTLPTAPTANFCSAGTYANDMSGSGPWNWSCTGSNGGSTANCSANKTPPPTVDLNAVPGIINVDNNPSWASGTPISLTWNNITNATTCTTDWNGASVGTSNGSSTFSQTTSSKNYTITCTGPGGTTNATANVFSACYPKVCASNQCVHSTTGPVSATSSAGCASSNKCSIDGDCQARVGSNWREIAP